MPPLTDLTAVRKRLDRDRDWAAYAIGDLAPGFVDQCHWHVPGNGSDALLLLYRGFDPPIAFAMGDAPDLHALFAEVTAPRISLHVRPEALDAMAHVFTPTHTRRMQRMTLRSARFAPADGGDVHAIAAHDLTAVTALYDDGHRRGEGPTFFGAAMLQQGTFYGVWEQRALVAIAGTHLYSAELGVCTVGNVYTRSDRRRRGLGARVTSAVVAHALRDGIPTIVLNVGVHNLTAQRVYERLGFEPYCHFFEGEARRTSL